MSLKDEIEELVGWLAQLTEDPAGTPEDVGRVTYRAWHLVVGRLSAAGAALDRARDGLYAAADPPREMTSADRATNPVLAGVLAEIAADLVRECEDLRRRAIIRRGLAPVESEDASVPEVVDEDSVDDTSEAAKEPTSNRPRRLPDSDKDGVRLADGRLRGAQKSLTTAMDHLSDRTADHEAISFAEELDVLAEMVLGLRRRVDEISTRTRSSRIQGAPAAPQNQPTGQPGGGSDD